MQSRPWLFLPGMAALVYVLAWQAPFHLVTPNADEARLARPCKLEAPRPDHATAQEHRRMAAFFRYRALQERKGPDTARARFIAEQLLPQPAPGLMLDESQFHLLRDPPNQHGLWALALWHEEAAERALLR